MKRRKAIDLEGADANITAVKNMWSRLSQEQQTSLGIISLEKDMDSAVSAPKDLDIAFAMVNEAPTAVSC